MGEPSAPTSQGTTPKPPQPPDVPRRLRLTLLQRIGIPVLVAIPIVAMTSLLGEHFTAVTKAASGIALRVEYPDRIHYRQPMPFRVTVKNIGAAPIDTVHVRISPEFMRAYTNVSLSVSLEGAYAFDLRDIAPDSERVISGTVEGERYGSSDGIARAYTRAGEVRVPLHAFVFP